MHTWARRLLLTRFGPPAIEAMTPITQRHRRRAHRRVRARRPHRRRHELRPAHPGAGHRHDARHPARRRGALHRTGPSASCSRASSTSTRRPRASARSSPTSPSSSPHAPPCPPTSGPTTSSRSSSRAEHEGAPLTTAPPDRVVLPAAARRHRHDVERDQRRPVAPRHPPRGPGPAAPRARRCCPPPSRRSCASTARSRWPATSPRTPSSTAARCTRATRCCWRSRPATATLRSSRTPDEFQHRPAAQPALRVRLRHPPLPRLQPRPHGAARRHRGVPRPHPAVHPRRTGPSQRGPVVRCAAHATSPCAGEPPSA